MRVLVAEVAEMALLGTRSRWSSVPWLTIWPRFWRMSRMEVGVLEMRTAETGRLISVQK